MTKEQILAEIARSRTAIAQNYASVRTELDFTAKLNSAMRRKPFAWLGGATALGWILAGPKTKTRVVTKTVLPGKKGAKGAAVVEGAAKAGIWASLFGLLRMAMPLLRPVITSYASKYAVEIARRYIK